MKKLLLSGVAALSLMLVHNAYAGEDEVVCLTPDASKALCGVLVTPRDAEIANAPHKTVILHGSGGLLSDYLDRFRELAESGNDVELRGRCMSGCTMIVAYIPAHRLCFGEWATLEFHSARSRADSSLPQPGATRMMLNMYPTNIRAWLLDKGGVEKMTIEEMWILTAPELWAMGYRKCGPGPLPALRNYRPEWK